MAWRRGRGITGRSSRRTGGEQRGERLFDHRLADVGAAQEDVLLADAAEVLVEDGADSGRLRGGVFDDLVDARLELPIGAKDDLQEVSDEGRGIVRLFVPSRRGERERLVVGLLRPLHEHLEADVFAHRASRAVEQQEREQTAHAAVAVGERVDAEKVQDEECGREERIVAAFFQRRPERIAECCHRHRRLPSGDGSETDGPGAAGVGLGDDVVARLPFAADADGKVGVEVAVQLTDHGGSDRDGVMAFVDGRQHVAVSENLALVPVPGRRLLRDKFAKALVRRIDALDPVRGVGTLDLRDFQKRVERVRLGAEVEILLPLVFVDGRKQGGDFRREKPGQGFIVAKCSHEASFLPTISQNLHILSSGICRFLAKEADSTENAERGSAKRSSIAPCVKMLR